MAKLLLVLAAALPLGCAHVEPRLATAEAAPPDRVLVTGSRLPQPVDPATGRARTTQNVRVYTIDDLNRTGVSDLNQALLRASPSGP